MTRTVRHAGRWVAAASVSSVAVAMVGGVTASAVAPRSTLSFSDPDAVATAGGHVWVANEGSNSLTQISAAGSVTLHVSDTHSDLHEPQALAGSSSDLFVANRSNTVSEFNAVTGVLVRTLTAKSFHFGDPVAMVVDGGDLWVVNQSTNCVTEVATATGKLVRTVANAPFSAVAFDAPSAITVAGADLWIASGGDNAVTEITSRTGLIDRIVSASADGLSDPAGVAYDGTHLWVTDSASDALTELMAGSGALVQVITNTSLNQGYGFWSPSVILSGAGVVYVASPPGGSPMITQIATSTGDANWMMCNTNYAFNFLNPDGMTIDAGNLFVANGANNTVTEMNASTGVLVRDVS